MKSLHICFVLFILFSFAGINYSQDMHNSNSPDQKKVIKLPAPQKEIGKPLMQALNLRQSSRSYSTKEIPLQDLSNLLWAAFGINRESGKRTAPSARDWREMNIFLAMTDGIYKYNAEENTIVQISKDDIRAGIEPFVFLKEAPLSLIYVADYSKLKGSSETDEVKLMYTSADAAFIVQNVYLYCASQGFASIVLGGINREKMTKQMGLDQDQKIIFAQCVGYPKEGH